MEDAVHLTGEFEVYHGIDLASKWTLYFLDYHLLFLQTLGFFIPGLVHPNLPELENLQLIQFNIQD